MSNTIPSFRRWQPNSQNSLRATNVESTVQSSSPQNENALTLRSSSISATATNNDSDVGYEQAHMTSVNEFRADRIADTLLSDMIQSVINDLTDSNNNEHESASQQPERDNAHNSEREISRTYLQPSRGRMNSRGMYEEEKTESTHMSSINGLLQVVRLEPSEQRFDDLSSQIGSSLLNPIDLQSKSQS